MKKENENLNAGSIAVFVTLFKYFLNDPDRPAIWRIIVNSILLLGSFALSIVALFGLPLALLVIMSSQTEGGQAFSLARIGLEGVSVSATVIVLGYLALYFLGVVTAYFARKMLVGDNVAYIERLTESVSADFDVAMKQNFVADGIALDRALFNRLSLGSSRTLPRIHFAILNGFMPAFFGLLSMLVLLITDFYLGLVVILSVILAVPFLLKSTDQSIKLNEDHAEDSRRFSEAFREYMGDTVFVSEVERSMREGGSEIDRATIEKFEVFDQHRRKFYDSFGKKQTAADDARLIVGVATLIMLGAGFFYFLYAPWASVKISSMFVLVLGFRYFIVALNGLASSFVSLTQGYSDLIEIITFREAIEAASRARAQNTSLSKVIEVVDLGRSRSDGIDVFGQDMLEVIIDRPLNYNNALLAFSELVRVPLPRYLTEVGAIGFSGGNYNRQDELSRWINNNLDRVKHVLGVPIEVEARNDKELKLAFEKVYFAKRKLKLPANMWALLCEWSFYQISLSARASHSYLVINGEVLARLPKVTRDLIINQVPLGAVVVLYEQPPSPFVSRDEDRFVIIKDQQVFAANKSLSYEECLELIEGAGKKALPSSPDRVLQNVAIRVGEA